MAVYETDSDCVGDAISVWMTDRNANPGEELLVPINVSSADTITPMGIQIEASYDPAFLDATTVDVRPTAITGMMSFLPNTTEPGRIIITTMGAMGGLGLKGQGHFFDIYAHIRDDVSAGTKSEITLDTVTFYDASVNPLCVEVDAAATLQAGGDLLLGDLNGDGKSDIGDALWALLIAVGKEPFESGHIITGDLNGDSRINCADSVLLQRLAAGFENVNPEAATDTTSDEMLLANILDGSVSYQRLH